MKFTPREYQEPAISCTVKSAEKHKNTLLPMATGSGKTVCMGFIEKELKGNKTLVIQNREELVNQNLATIKSITLKDCTIVKASVNDYSGDIVFASTQSLIKKKRLDEMPVWDNIFIDEAHLMGYEKIIKKAKENNKETLVIGYTATPYWEKGQDIFNNVAYAIEIPELVKKGMLKRPIAKTFSLGVEEELSKVKIKGNDFDQKEVGEIVNKPVLNEEVLRVWKEQASDRSTIFFCPTIDHAEELQAIFELDGISSKVISSKTKNTKKEPLRKQYIEDFKVGKIQCLFSVQALTAGFDAPIASCAVMLRTFLSKNNFIQAVGRTLRLHDNNDDALILDFTGCCPRHGDIDTPFKLFKSATNYSGEVDVKLCPVCNAELHVKVSCCPFCGFDWNVEIEEQYEEYAKVIGFKEFELLRESRFEWREMTRPCDLIISSSKEVLSIVIKKDGSWIGFGINKKRIQHLYTGSREACIKICDNFMGAKYKKYSGTKNYSAKYMEPADYRMKPLNELGIQYTYEVLDSKAVYDYRKKKYTYPRKYTLTNGTVLDDYMAELIIKWFKIREDIFKIMEKI